MSELRVTVAICTRDRVVELRRALQSLEKQTRVPWEVLVVDNAPSQQESRAMVTAGFASARYVEAPVAGLDFARNQALRAATGEVVAFLDDDAVADLTWVAAVHDAFTAFPRAGLCTGRVEPLMLETDAQRLFEANGGFSRGSARIRLPMDAGRPLHGFPAPLIAWAVSVGSGCSLAVRRERALALGGFDEALDLGSALPGGGDLDMIWRMLDTGDEVVYEPQVLAWHEHRRDMVMVEEQLLGHQRALVALLVKSAANARGRRRLAVSAFLLWRLLKPGARLVRRVIGRDPLPAPLLGRMWLHCWRGLFAYSAARRLADQRRQAAS